MNDVDSATQLDRYRPANIPFRSYYRRFLIYSCAIILAFGLTGVAALRIEIDLQEKEDLAQNLAAVELAASLAHRDFETVVADIAFLANDETILDFLKSENSERRIKPIEHEFLNLSMTSHLYDQIRLIGPSGYEIARINFRDGASIIVPPEKLQNKLNRYYFSEAAKLPKGEVYISPIDLNIEDGKVEIPYKPMIRYATPLYDASGAFRGVIVLNYLGKIFLDQFRSQMDLAPGTGMLVNRNGFWLSSPNSRDEWGFMFGGDTTFGTKYPDAWTTIKEEDSGWVDTSGGRFSFTTVNPFDRTTNAAVVTPQLEDWKIIAVSNFEPISLSLIVHHLKRFYPLIFLLPIALFFAWYTARASIGKKIADQKLALVNLSLEEQVDVRTTELQIALRDAKLANHTKTQFLANMSHELRTPLNAIIGFSQLFVDNIFGPLGNKKYEEYAKDINRSSSDLSNIIAGILDVSLIEDGGISLNDQAIDVADIVQETVSILQGKAEKFHIRVITILPEKSLSIYADKLRLKQVLVNILSNAIKFSRKNGTVKLQAFLDADDCVTFKVSDLGLGMKPEDTENAMKAFVQLGDKTKNPNEGAGLGLFIAKSLTAEHNGKLEVFSEIGEGTTVTISLPTNRTVRNTGYLRSDTTAPLESAANG